MAQLFPAQEAQEEPPPAERPLWRAVPPWTAKVLICRSVRLEPHSSQGTRRRRSDARQRTSNRAPQRAHA